MFVAQQQLEKYKTTQPEGSSSSYILIEGYYVKLISDNKPGGNIDRVTISVRRDPNSSADEIILQSHIIKD